MIRATGCFILVRMLNPNQKREEKSIGDEQKEKETSDNTIRKRELPSVQVQEA